MIPRLRLASVFAPFLLVPLGLQAAFVWVEGEDARRANNVTHNWYGGAVKKGELSGNDFLSHFANREAEAQYRIDIPEAGTYAFWLRANPSAGASLSFSVNEGPFVPVDFSGSLDRVNIATDGAPDMRYVAWVKVGEFDLQAQTYDLRLKMDSKNQNHGSIDVIVFTSDPFLPNGKLKPGEKTGLANAGFWAFEPSADFFRDEALVDLSILNHKPAGKRGFIRLSEDGDSFVTEDGQAIRFWATTTYVHLNYSMDDLKRHARFLAKRGVNMVRHHGDLTPRQGEPLDAVREAQIDGLFKLVAAMKEEGIYVTFSPYWGSHTDWQDHWGLDSPDNGNLSGLLFFDETLQEAYKGWVREALTRVNPHTGLALKDDPALAIFQIQNEDSLLFWTMQRVKGEQRRKLNALFYDFLADKYGSISRAQQAWGGSPEAPGDDLANGIAGTYPIWDFTQERGGPRGKRIADQLEFYAGLMYDFNTEIERFLREDLGARQLINAGNWRTADNVKLLDSERYAYTANEVIGINKYFGVVHKGERAGYNIGKGDQFLPRSAIRHPRLLPTNIKQVAGHPMIIPESNWVPPNPYQSEGPFLTAIYQSLTGVDAFYWFSYPHIGYGRPFGKWQASSPMVAGQWPANALAFRRGYIQEADPVVLERRSLEEMWMRRDPIIAEEAGYDPNRDSNISPLSSVQSGIDPLAFLVGPVLTEYDADPATTEVIDLDRYIDRRSGRILSRTGEIVLQREEGYVALNAPKAQGVAGWLGDLGPVDLDAVSLDVRSEYATVVVVALDDMNLAASERILVQMGTVNQPYDYETRPSRFRDGETTYNGREITNLGQFPWNIAKLEGSITVRNMHARRATVLDANFEPVREIPVRREGLSVSFRLPEDALYVLIH